MNEIIVARHIEGITINDYEYLLDESGDEIKFPTADHAKRWLKQEEYSEREIGTMSFIYTNESRECKCHLCEKRGDCYMQDKFQRLPRDKTNGLGLGLCPKLEAVKGGNT